jgi:signal transduction histidine kinase
MKLPNLTPRVALVLFVILTAILIAQAVWWIIFMARMIDEKVEQAEQLGAPPEVVEQIHREEVHRQIMVGSEGVFFLILTLVGVGLIYRSVVRAEQLKFQQQNFLMAITHELRTPIASIRLYLDTLQSERVPSEQKAELIPRIRDNLGRLERLVDDALDAGRLDRGGYRLQSEVFDLTKLIEELLDHPPASRAELKIRRNLPEKAPLYGDRAALSRALNAVIINAIKYNDSDPIELDLSLIQTGGQYRIEITDNGRGLSAVDTRRIFDRFYRAEDERLGHSGGSGLGLYLAREIIRAHDGRIRAESPGPNRGASFIIHLPVKERP